MDFLKRPTTDFNAVRDGRQSMPLYVDIDVSTARSIADGTALAINIAGNSLFANPDPAGGVCIVHFQDTNLGISSAPFYVSPGFIANVGFTQLLIENAAQPGRKIRLFYGVDMGFLPGSSTSVAISGQIENKITAGDKSNSVSGSYAGGVALISAAANISGVVVTGATLEVKTTLANYMLGTPYMSVGIGNRHLSKITSTVISGTNIIVTCDLPNNLYIPAGQALYCWGCQATDTGFVGYATWSNA